MEYVLWYLVIGLAIHLGCLCFERPRTWGDVITGSFVLMLLWPLLLFAFWIMCLFKLDEPAVKDPTKEEKT